MLGFKPTQQSSYKWWVFAALAIGLFTSAADNSSVVIALPTIADYFRTDLPTTQWVVIGYLLTISAFLMPMGRLSDIVGRKRVYVTGYIIFVVAAGLAGLSTNVLSLILFKVLQGIGAGMTQGTSMAMMVAAFPPNERGKSLGLQMSVVGVGAVTGPPLAGFLVSTLGWRSVFFTSFIMGTLSVIAAFIILDERRMRQASSQSSFDWLGAALSTAALVTFLLAMTIGSRAGWVSPLILGAMLAVVALLGAFVWWELRASEPMLDVRFFKRKLFALGVSASFINFLGMSSIRFLMPFYLQAVLGYNAGQVGLIIVPGAFTFIVMGPLSGRLSDRFGWRLLNIGGLTVSAIGLFIMSTLRVDSSVGVAMAGIILQSAGTGMFNAPNSSSILSAVDRSKYGVVSGFLSVVRNSANVTSIALVTAIVTATMASMSYPPSLSAVSESGGAGVLGAFTSGLRAAYLVIGGLALVGIVLSFFKGGQAAPTPEEPEGETATGKTSA